MHSRCVEPDWRPARRQSARHPSAFEHQAARAGSGVIWAASAASSELLSCASPSLAPTSGSAAHHPIILPIHPHMNSAYSSFRSSMKPSTRARSSKWSPPSPCGGRAGGWAASHRMAGRQGWGQLQAPASERRRIAAAAARARTHFTAGALPPAGRTRCERSSCRRHQWPSPAGPAGAAPPPSRRRHSRPPAARAAAAGVGGQVSGGGGPVLALLLHVQSVHSLSRQAHLLGAALLPCAAVRRRCLLAAAVAGGLAASRLGFRCFMLLLLVPHLECGQSSWRLQEVQGRRAEGGLLTW